MTVRKIFSHRDGAVLVLLLASGLWLAGCSKKEAPATSANPGVAAAEANVEAAQKAVDEANQSGTPEQRAAADQALEAAKASLAAAQSPGAIPGGSPAPAEGGGEPASNPAAAAPAAGSPATAAPAGAASALTPAAPPPPKQVTVPAGTVVAVRTTTPLTTKTAEVGNVFAASLTRALVVDGETIAPRGADVEGVVTETDPGGRVRGVATLGVRLQKLKLADGAKIDISTNAFVTQAGKSVKKDAAKVGIGAAVGAAIGAIAGGGKGAAIGAGVGGGAGGATVLATRGNPAEIPAESVINFHLAAPFTVEVKP
jgi:hypothetical protein